ncbi:unnamed protein product [Effrenium voratum]|nr:unnamed protein product [Effrenium voratum]
MPAAGIEPDAISFNTALGAVDKGGGGWPVALCLLEERHSPDRVSAAVVVACCEASRAVAPAVRVARRCIQETQEPVVLPALQEVVPSFEHTSVLLQEVLEAFAAVQPALVVDCTLGGAGHGKALLEALPQVRLLGIDRDPAALAAAAERLAPFGSDRVHLARANFAQLPEALQASGFDLPCEGLLADLGVSSPQLDRGERGFSFRLDGPLDMRMDASDGIRPASWYIANLPPQQLAAHLCELGEEEPGFAQRVAEALCAAKPQRTREAALIIEECARDLPRGRVHVATKTFQALRILVNGELSALEGLLQNAEDVLVPGGLLAIITFHSLEDDLVRRKVRGTSLARGGGQTSCWIPAGSREGLRPSEGEVASNPRSRSARLRLAVRAGSVHGGRANEKK